MEPIYYQVIQREFMAPSFTRERVAITTPSIELAARVAAAAKLDAVSLNAARGTAAEYFITVREGAR